MRRNTQSLNPSSPFYHSQSYSDRLNHLRSNPFVSHSPSTAYQRSSQFTDDVLSRLDQIDVLGGPDSHGTEIGHEGCVNALAWSQSGHCLATGSDDRKVILWKLGSSDVNARSVQASRGAGAETLRAYPNLDLAQAEMIQTGHRANIFNVKWAPNCSDRRLFTCAGDCQVRVFDLSRATASTNVQLESGKEYKYWEKSQGACIRVLKCHSSRAKKISTENSPDIFLTAAEDGEIRQTDLRVSVSISRG
jgi:nuclear receptor interaction protein